MGGRCPDFFTAADRAAFEVASSCSSSEKSNNKQLQWLYQVPGDELLVNQSRVEEDIAKDDWILAR